MATVGVSQTSAFPKTWSTRSEIEVILASGLGLVSSECQNRLSWSVSTRGSVAPARRREGRLWTAEAGVSASRAEGVAGATGFSAKAILMALRQPRSRPCSGWPLVALTVV